MTIEVSNEENDSKVLKRQLHDILNEITKYNSCIQSRSKNQKVSSLQENLSIDDWFYACKNKYTEVYEANLPIALATRSILKHLCIGDLTEPELTKAVLSDFENVQTPYPTRSNRLPVSRTHVTNVTGVLLGLGLVQETSRLTSTSRHSSYSSTQASLPNITTPTVEPEPDDSNSQETLKSKLEKQRIVSKVDDPILEALEKRCIKVFTEYQNNINNQNNILKLTPFERQQELFTTSTNNTTSISGICDKIIKAEEISTTSTSDTLLPTQTFSTSDLTINSDIRTSTTTNSTLLGSDINLTDFTKMEAPLDELMNFADMVADDVEVLEEDGDDESVNEELETLSMDQDQVDDEDNLAEDGSEQPQDGGDEDDSEAMCVEDATSNEPISVDAQEGGLIELTTHDQGQREPAEQLGERRIEARDVDFFHHSLVTTAVPLTDMEMNISSTTSTATTTSAINVANTSVNDSDIIKPKHFYEGKSTSKTTNIDMTDVTSTKSDNPTDNPLQATSLKAYHIDHSETNISTFTDPKTILSDWCRQIFDFHRMSAKEIYLLRTLLQQCELPSLLIPMNIYDSNYLHTDIVRNHTSSTDNPMGSSTSSSVGNNTSTIIKSRHKKANPKHLATISAMELWDRAHRKKQRTSFLPIPPFLAHTSNMSGSDIYTGIGTSTSSNVSTTKVETAYSRRKLQQQQQLQGTYSSGVGGLTGMTTTTTTGPSTRSRNYNAPLYIRGLDIITYDQQPSTSSIHSTSTSTSTSTSKIIQTPSVIRSNPYTNEIELPDLNIRTAPVNWTGIVKEFTLFKSEDMLSESWIATPRFAQSPPVSTPKGSSLSSHTERVFFGRGGSQGTSKSQPPPSPSPLEDEPDTSTHDRLAVSIAGTSGETGLAYDPSTPVAPMTTDDAIPVGQSELPLPLLPIGQSDVLTVPPIVVDHSNVSITVTQTSNDSTTTSNCTSNNRTLSSSNNRSEIDTNIISNNPAVIDLSLDTSIVEDATPELYDSDTNEVYEYNPGSNFHPSSSTSSSGVGQERSIQSDYKRFCRRSDTVKALQEVLAPTYRLLSEPNRSSGMINSGLSIDYDISSEEESFEDLTDEAVGARHDAVLLRMRSRYAELLKNHQQSRSSILSRLSNITTSQHTVSTSNSHSNTGGNTTTSSASGGTKGSHKPTNNSSKQTTAKVIHVPLTTSLSTTTASSTSSTSSAPKVLSVKVSGGAVGRPANPRKRGRPPKVSRELLDYRRALQLQPQIESTTKRENGNELEGIVVQLGVVNEEQQQHRDSHNLLVPNVSVGDTSALMTQGGTSDQSNNADDYENTSKGNMSSNTLTTSMTDSQIDNPSHNSNSNHSVIIISSNIIIKNYQKQCEEPSEVVISTSDDSDMLNKNNGNIALLNPK